MKMGRTQNSKIDDFTDDDLVQNVLNLWNYTETPELFGVIVEIRPGTYSERQVKVKDVADDEIMVPELTTLNSKLQMAKVGDKVKIVYKGEKKSEKTGRMYKDFDVFIKH